MKKKFVAVSLATLITATGWVGAVPVSAVTNTAPGKPYDLKVEMLEQAYGLGTKNPAFSWVVNDADRDEVQTAYRIVVSSRSKLAGDVYDTGWVNDNENSYVHIDALETLLSDNELYYWQVQTKDKAGEQSPLSDANAFMTGIGSQWQSLDGIWAIPNASSSKADSLWSDYTLEQTMSVTEGGALGLLFRIGQGSRNGYLIQFRTNDNVVKFHQITGGTVDTNAFYTLELSGKGIKLPTDGSAFKVKIAAERSNFAFSFDTNAADGTDSYVDAGSVDISGAGNLLSGTFGYRTGRFESGTVDAVKVTAADGTVLYASDFSENDQLFPGLSVQSGKLQIGKSVFCVYSGKLSDDDTLLEERGRFAFIRSPKLTDSGKEIDKVIVSSASRGTGNDRGIIYDLFLNGECLGAGSARELKDAGKEAESTVQRRIYYNSYDATELWNKGGENVISALGNSRDIARSILVQVTAFYTDGTKEIISNSGRDHDSWKTLDGTNAFGDDGSGIATGFFTLLHDNVNMNYYPSGWKEIDFDDSGWASAQISYKPADTANITAGGNVLYPFGSENALRVETNEESKKVYENTSGNLVVDLGKEIIGGLKINIDSAAAQKITVHMGEEMNSDGTVKWQMTSAPKYEDFWTLKQGINAFETATMRNFRYVEFVGLDEATKANIIKAPDSVNGWAIQQGFDSDDSYFEATDGSAQAELLNRLYELCKYTIQATNQDVFVDSQARERGAYEGDLLVNANTSYAVSGNYTLARHSNEWLIDNPTWPNDYRIFSVEMAWADYMYTGNTDSISEYYTALKKKLTTIVEYEDPSTGLIRPKNSTAGNSALIDWPLSERDGYQPGYYDVVLNCEYIGIYLNMAEISEALGYSDDAAYYRGKSDRLKAVLLEYAYDEENGCFYDSLSENYIATKHSSTHATAYALTYGVFEDQEMADRMCEFVYNNCKDEFKGSVYATYFILKGLYVGNHGELAERLMTNPKVGTDVKTFASLLDDLNCTITPEAWGHKWKGNMTLSHPWGASPGCSITQGMFGIMPTKAGFEEFTVKLQPGEVGSAKIKAPTVKGAVYASYEKTDDTILASVTVPVNTKATVYLPDMGDASASSLMLDGKKVTAEREGGFLKVKIGSGTHTLSTVKHEKLIISIADGEETLFTDTKYPVSVLYEMPDGKYVDASEQGTLTYSVSDTAVAEITDDGTLILHAEGSAVITVKLTVGDQVYETSIAVIAVDEPGPDHFPGDVDGNGSVNVSDIVSLKALIMNGSWTDDQLKRGDIDKNNTLNVSDMLAIKNIIMTK